MKKILLLNSFFILFLISLLYNENDTVADEINVSNTQCIVHDRSGNVACGGKATECIKHDRSGKVACGGLATECIKHDRSGKVACGGKATECIKHDRSGNVNCGGLATKCIVHDRSGNVACGIDDYWHRYINTTLKDIEDN